MAETAHHPAAATTGSPAPVRSRWSEWSWNVGAAAALALGTWLTVRTWVALERAREALDAHVARYGSLPISLDGGVRSIDHAAPDATALTADIDAASGFLYPFGELTAVGGSAAVVVAVAVLTGKARPILGAAAVAGTAIVALLVRHHATLRDVMVILE